jgi:hypothetical protein
VLFVFASALSAWRKNVTQGFDELAHASYVAHLQSNHEIWPTLENMRMLDPASLQFTSAANYLNHPPMFYAIMARLGPTLEGHPGALLLHRFLNIVLAMIGLAVMLAIAAQLPRIEFYAYAAPLVCMPVLVPLAGAINNDNLAFAGGAVVTLAAWRLVATGREKWLWVALAGIIAAAWAKLTGLLLAGGMVAVLLAYLLWRRRLQRSLVIAAAIALLAAAVPYLIFITQYGNPTPNTPAQMALIADGAQAVGWNDAVRLSLPAYTVYFVSAFVTDWMPTLAQRGTFHYAMLVIPVMTLLCALAGLALSLRRLVRREETATDVVVIAGALALAATFALHIGYSYGRHLTTGWMMDAYPRYYLPLAAIVPLASLSLLAAIETPRVRIMLAGFLVAGPPVFQLLGAPHG